MTFVSILPPNSTPLERALEASFAARLDALPLPVGQMMNPATCPTAFLPWLAWALSVDEWSPEWTEETKRAVIAASIAVHRRKGTIAAIKAAMDAMGYGQVTVTEGRSTMVGGDWAVGDERRIYTDSPSTSISQSLIALIDFTDGGVRQSGLDFLAGFSRASAATFIDAAGNIQTAAANTPRLEHVGGGVTALLMEAGATRINPYVSIRDAWVSKISGVTDIDLSENALGVFGGLQIISDGTISGRIFTTISVTTSAPYAVKFLYRAGTSGQVRFQFQDTAGGTFSIFSGVIGSLQPAVITTGAGTLSLLRDTEMLGGLRETVLIWTPNFTGTARMGIGPNSAVAGQTIDAFAWQAEQGAGDTSWILGDANATVERAPDVANIAIPAEAVTQLGSGLWVVAGGVVLDGVVGTVDRIYQLDNGNNGNSLMLRHDTSVSGLRVQQFALPDTSFQVSTSTAYAFGDRVNIATRFAPNQFANIWPDGSEVEDLLAEYVVPTVLRLAANTAGIHKPSRVLIERIALAPPDFVPADVSAYMASPTPTYQSVPAATAVTVGGAQHWAEYWLTIQQAITPDEVAKIHQRMAQVAPARCHLARIIAETVTTVAGGPWAVGDNAVTVGSTYRMEI